MTKSDTILKSEKQYETFLIENIEEVSLNCGWGGIERIERQYVLPLKNGRIICDLMIWHKDGTGTCIEVKTGKNNRNDDLMGLGQLMFYGSIMEEYLENMPRMVLVCPKLKQELWQVVKRFNIPIDLLELTNDKCIYLRNGTR